MNDCKEGIQRLLVFHKERLPESIRALQTGNHSKVLRGYAFDSVEGFAVASGMAAYLLESDVEAFKYWFSIATRAALGSAKYQGAEEFTTKRPLVSALLSDSEELIQLTAFADVPLLDSAPQHPGAPSQEVHMMQLAMRPDVSALEEAIGRLGNGNPKKPLTKDSRYFFSLLCARDVDALTEMISRHATAEHVAPAAFEGCMAYRATWETKLCWRWGLEIHIDHPKVPMDLMPIRPLERYDPLYDFLRPDWIPPRGGIAGFMDRLRGKR